MSFAIFKGETSMKALVSRLFGFSEKSSQANIDQAASALLRANPQLQNMGKVAYGSLILVPPNAPPLAPGQVTPAIRAAIAARAQQTMITLDRRLTEIESLVTNRTNAFLAIAQSTQVQAAAKSSVQTKAQLPAMITSLQNVASTTQTTQVSRKQTLSVLQASLKSFAQSKT